MVIKENASLYEGLSTFNNKQVKTMVTAAAEYPRPKNQFFIFGDTHYYNSSFLLGCEFLWRLFHFISKINSEKAFTVGKGHGSWDMNCCILLNFFLLNKRQAKVTQAGNKGFLPTCISVPLFKSKKSKYL